MTSGSQSRFRYLVHSDCSKGTLRMLSSWTGLNPVSGIWFIPIYSIKTLLMNGPVRQVSIPFPVSGSFRYNAIVAYGDAELVFVSIPFPVSGSFRCT